MGTYDVLKDAAKILKEAGKIEEYQKILELQEKLQEMQNAIFELEKENRNLKEKFEIKEKLTLKNHAYWIGEDGPLCIRCWDKDKQVIHMIPTYVGSNDSECPECETQANITGKDNYEKYEDLEVRGFPREEF